MYLAVKQWRSSGEAVKEAVREAVKEAVKEAVEEAVEEALCSKSSTITKAAL